MTPSITTTFAGATFSPKKREDLKVAVDACLDLSAVGDFSTGPYGPIGEWDVSHVNDTREMFSAMQEFNQDLSKWDVSKVTGMQGMFFKASGFNGDLSTWNVGQVTSMDNMFSGAKSFNQDLSKWNVAQVDGMLWMFYGAIAFNQDLSKWNVGQVASMEYMFSEATSFKRLPLKGTYPSGMLARSPSLTTCFMLPILSTRTCPDGTWHKSTT